MSGVAAAIANAKKRDGIGYFALSLVVSPLAGVVLAWALPPLGKSSTTKRLTRGTLVGLQRPRAGTAASPERTLGIDLMAIPTIGVDTALTVVVGALVEATVMSEDW